MGDKAPKYEVNPGLKAILAEGRTSTFSLTNLFDSQDFKRDEENDQLPNGEQGGEYADDQQFDDGQQSGDGQQSDDDQQFEDAPKSRHPKKMPDESRPDEAQKDGALERRSNRQRTEEDHSNREHLDGDHSNQLLEEDRSNRQRPGDRNQFRSESTWENFFFGKNDERFERLKFYDSDKIEKHNKDWNRKKEQLVMALARRRKSMKKSQYTGDANRGPFNRFNNKSNFKKPPPKQPFKRKSDVQTDAQPSQKLRSK